MTRKQTNSTKRKVRNQSEVIKYKGFTIQVIPWNENRGKDWEYCVVDDATGYVWGGTCAYGKRAAITEAKITADDRLEEEINNV